MAHIVPSISFLKSIKRHLYSGHSVNRSLDLAIAEEDSGFTVQVIHWRAASQRGVRDPHQFAETHFQVALLQIIESGLDGAPIFELLGDLEAEMCEEFDRQWKLYLERLPLLLSLPLLLFFFPAYVVLMFGPLIVQFLSEVN